MPKVSIGLPVYNGQNYLAQAIDSILAQSFTDFELIICDNASTDATESICRGYAAADPRVRYHRNPQNLGAAPNFNLCVDLADGLYFKWAAHDDILTPDYLALCVAVLDSDPTVAMCHTGSVFIDEEGTVVQDYTLETGRFAASSQAERFGNAIDERHFCVTVFGLVRMSVLMQTSKIMSYIGSDRSLIAEIALRGRIEHVPDVAFLSRDHRERSIRALKLDDRAAWFDASRPKAGKRHYWRMLRHHLRVLGAGPMPLGERWRGLLKIWDWLWYNKRKLLAEILPQQA